MQPVSDMADSTKSQPSNTPAASLVNPSRDSFVYFTTCMSGHLVEVHLKNGSVYSGIFDAADIEKDFGIILKMASLIKDGILRGHKSRYEFFRKPPYKTFIIPAHELVQVLATDLCISSDDTLKAVQSKKPGDSSIPKPHYIDKKRNLKRWVPKADVPPVPDVENVPNDPLKREREQFESTFDEDHDTSSRTREREEKAQGSAREIKGENTQDLHVAEERGLQRSDKQDTCNDQNLGGSSTSDGQKPASSSDQGYEELRDDSQNTNVDLLAPGASISESKLGEQRNNGDADVSHDNRSAEESVTGHGGDIKDGAEFVEDGTSESKIVADRERQVSQVSDVKQPQNSSGSPEIYTSVPASGLPGLSPVDSLSSSEKPTLNPNAKEFVSQRTQQTRWSQEPHGSQQHQQSGWPREPNQQSQQPYWSQQRYPLPYAAHESFYCPVGHGQQMPENPAGYYYVVQVQQQGILSYTGQQQIHYHPRLAAQHPPPPQRAQHGGYQQQQQHPPPPRAQHAYQQQHPPAAPPSPPPVIVTRSRSI